MKRLAWTALAAWLTAAAPVAAFAQHAFAAEFDRNKPIELTGTVTKIEWMNPHARIYVDAPDPEQNGEIVTWDLELGSPNNLMRRGWTRNSLQVGQTVTIQGWRARNAPHVGNARSVTGTDGKRLFAGSSGEDESQ